MVEGTQEAIETTRATGARTQVAHILARRGSGGVEANERIVETLEGAAADGLPIAWDVHTRLFGITNLSSALPPGSAEPSDIRMEADDPNVVSSFGRAGWDRTFVFEAGEAFEDLTGASVADAAAARGCEPRDLLVEVLQRGGSGTASCTGRWPSAIRTRKRTSWLPSGPASAPSARTRRR